MNNRYLNMGMKMRRIRNDRGITQEMIARSVGIAPAYYGQLERATKVPSLQTLFKISDVLNINPALLVNEENDETDYAVRNLKGLMKSLNTKQKKFIAVLLRDAVLHIKKFR